MAVFAHSLVLRQRITFDGLIEPAAFRLRGAIADAVDDAFISSSTFSAQYPDNHPRHLKSDCLDRVWWTPVVLWDTDELRSWSGGCCGSGGVCFQFHCGSRCHDHPPHCRGHRTSTETEQRPFSSSALLPASGNPSVDPHGVDPPPVYWSSTQPHPPECRRAAQSGASSRTWCGVGLDVPQISSSLIRTSESRDVHCPGPSSSDCRMESRGIRAVPIIVSHINPLFHSSTTKPDSRWLISNIKSCSQHG
ncbi:uncharacterized protein LOC115425602 [Sphaeramia orbicularis]|uniref:uncharacterized protein LOC115425602 n=1 Tax=Sphaeramia orbicularis TaxID=375764 RepID=UPI00117F4D66|nr:uncharacterized protein LOC115425602 [Sphaeramia orbicularis]